MRCDSIVWGPPPARLCDVRGVDQTFHQSTAQNQRAKAVAHLTLIRPKNKNRMENPFPVIQPTCKHYVFPVHVSKTLLRVTAVKAVTPKTLSLNSSMCPKDLLLELNSRISGDVLRSHHPCWTPVCTAISHFGGWSWVLRHSLHLLHVGCTRQTPRRRAEAASEVPSALTTRRAH